MSVPVRLPSSAWVAAHRAFLLLSALLAVVAAVAITAVVLFARSGDASTPSPAPTVHSGSVQPQTNPCLAPRPGRPIPC